MQIQYSFNLYNCMAESGITLALKKLMPSKEGAPVVVCIGSDLSVGDSLGPICGTKLKSKLKGTNCYVYGTLSKPVTAHEIKYINEFVRATHPGSPVIAIDAAVGNEGDIGLIKLSRRGVRPGSGANKRSVLRYVCNGRVRKTVPLCANVIAAAAFAFSPSGLCFLQNALIYVVFCGIFSFRR